MLHYRSDHPNHVHQLVISVSKNFYLDEKENILRYQKKDMNVSLASLEKAKKRHMIIYSIRDHCSGVFYSEISFAPKIFRPQDFLSRAWGIKEDYDFRGIPDCLTIPKTLQEKFPDLVQDITKLGIKLLEVTSGFQGGIRDINTIEKALLISANRDISDALHWVSEIYRSISKQKARISEITKIEMWASGVPEIVVPPLNWGKDS